MERVLVFLVVIVIGIFGWMFAVSYFAELENQEVGENEEGKPINTSERFAESYTKEFKPLRVGRPFPVINSVPVFDVETADKELQANDLVLGVEINGTARAYPIAMISQPIREVFNDQLGGTAIAATW